MIDVCGRITEEKNRFEISYGTTERRSSSFVLASLLAWSSVYWGIISCPECIQKVFHSPFRIVRGGGVMVEMEFLKAGGLGVLRLGGSSLDLEIL